MAQKKRNWDKALGLKPLPQDAEGQRDEALRLIWDQLKNLAFQSMCSGGLTDEQILWKYKAIRLLEPHAVRLSLKELIPKEKTK